MQYLTPRQFAQRYGVQEESVRIALRAGRIEGAFKVMNRWRIPENAGITTPKGQDKK